LGIAGAYRIDGRPYKSALLDTDWDLADARRRQWLNTERQQHTLEKLNEYRGRRVSSTAITSPSRMASSTWSTVAT
jgi:hypothetical protein